MFVVGRSRLEHRRFEQSEERRGPKGILNLQGVANSSIFRPESVSVSGVETRSPLALAGSSERQPWLLCLQVVLRPKATKRRGMKREVGERDRTFRSDNVVGRSVATLRAGTGSRLAAYCEWRRLRLDGLVLGLLR